MRTLVALAVLGVVAGTMLASLEMLGRASRERPVRPWMP